MKTPRQLKLSVVIPAHNEGLMIDTCLEALAAQTRPVDEIIIVDNNSTDDTAERARAHKNVTVIREAKQGIAHARSAGFDYAQGDIICRIDVDTIVAPEWAEVIEQRFAADPELAALGGDGAVAELSPAGKFWFGWYFPLYRKWNQRYLQFAPIVYGFNGAFTKEAWRIIKPLTTTERRINEDLDLTISLLKSDLKIGYEPRMRVKFHLFEQTTPRKIRQYYNDTRNTLTRQRFGNRKRWLAVDDKMD